MLQRKETGEIHPGRSTGVQRQISGCSPHVGTWGHCLPAPGCDSQPGISPHSWCLFLLAINHTLPLWAELTSSLQPFLVAGLILCLHFLLSLERMWHSQSPRPKSHSQTVWWPKLQADKDSPYFVDQEINSQELRVKARPPFTTHLLQFINFYNTLLVGIFIERIFVLVIS